MAQQYTIRPEVLEAESGSEIKRFAFYLSELRNDATAIFVIRANCRPEYYAKFSTMRFDGWVKDDFENFLDSAQYLANAVKNSLMPFETKRYFLRQIRALRYSMKDRVKGRVRKGKRRLEAF